MTRSKLVEWIEPFGPNNEPVYMRVEEATAIAYQRNLHEYKSDAEALDDFKSVHRAYQPAEPALILDGEHWSRVEVSVKRHDIAWDISQCLLDLREGVRRGQPKS